MPEKKTYLPETAQAAKARIERVRLRNAEADAWAEECNRLMQEGEKETANEAPSGIQGSAEKTA